MIALDTDILARFYVDDPADPEDAQQRPIARHIMTHSPSLFVPLTVVLELAWVLRPFYRVEATQIVGGCIGVVVAARWRAAGARVVEDPGRRPAVG